MSYDQTPIPEPKVENLPKINRSRMSKLRQSLNAKLVAAQVKMLLRRNDEPMFNMRPLRESELNVTLTTRKNHIESCETVRRKCNVCLDPATHLEYMDASKDPDYTRFLCETCAKKNVTPAIVFFNAKKSEAIAGGMADPEQLKESQG